MHKCERMYVRGKGWIMKWTLHIKFEAYANFQLSIALVYYPYHLFVPCMPSEVLHRFSFYIRKSTHLIVTWQKLT